MDIEGLLTPVELRQIRNEIGLSQSGAAEWVGVSDFTWYRWESGDKPLTAHYSARIREQHARFKSEAGQPGGPAHCELETPPVGSVAAAQAAMRRIVRSHPDAAQDLEPVHACLEQLHALSCDAMAQLESLARSGQVEGELTRARIGHLTKELAKLSRKI